MPPYEMGRPGRTTRIPFRRIHCLDTITISCPLARPTDTTQHPPPSLNSPRSRQPPSRKHRKKRWPLSLVPGWQVLAALPAMTLAPRQMRHGKRLMESQSPPRPEEPDNCCMSGCVHCVWDDFRDELEDWASRLEQAKAKGVTKSGATDMRHTPRAEVATASTSMDDDGGGSETNWSVPKSGDDLFADIPVGIREFMKTEKKLKQRHQQEGHT
ncbi:hypothetical protein ASPCADRAFT_211111 [Aspergillus carbonarius ITEM 5010]|uniref:Oxidoreductase-like domain-containing protein n=1 Tax=Aspergillus carbonarius (strain ITEM 5010) TaxID=602072 RepID=A0A1R3R9W8_ASPC5|nr:hypothetical protein ASPCADRAFT_211111 [Aspergillus carbonarius ITEM 5010]